MNWRERLSALLGGNSRPVSVAAADRALPTAGAIPLKPTLARVASASTDEPGFSATAGDQLREVGTGPVERARLKLRGVLTPSQPVRDPKAFAGRRKLLQKIINAVEEQRLHVILYGSRGMGKTSLLHILSQRARDARYTVLYGSCGAATSFSDMFRRLCADIPLRFYGSSRHSAAKPDSGATIAKLLPDGEFTPAIVTEILSRITGTRVLIILDEFDRSDEGPFRRAIADLIKTLSDLAVRSQLIIGGVGSNVTELIEHIPSIQRNVVGVQVTPLTDLEVRHLLKIAHEQVGLDFEPAAADLIVQLAEGWPYVASLLSHHAVLTAIEAKRMTVERNDVVAALEGAVQEVQGRLAPDSRKEIERATSVESSECLALAAKAHIHFGGEFQPESLMKIADQPGIASRCEKTIEELAEHDLLFVVTADRFGRTYSFKDSTVPLYIWLSRSSPGLEPVAMPEQEENA